MTDVKAWATDMVHEMSDQEVWLVVTEGAESWRDRLGARLPASFGVDELDALLDEVERLCQERLT